MGTRNLFFGTSSSILKAFGNSGGGGRRPTFGVEGLKYDIYYGWGRGIKVTFTPNFRLTTMLQIETSPGVSEICSYAELIGPTVWNQIPENIKSSVSLAIFKQKLENFYLENYNR